MAFSVDQIDHVEVFVRDIEASVRWYAEVLGLQEICRWEPHPVIIGAGGTMLALFQAHRNATAPTPAKLASRLRWRLVAWRTAFDAFENVREHLTRCGVEYDGPVDHGASKSVYFCDLDGHPLEITCYCSDATQLMDRVVGA